MKSPTLPELLERFRTSAIAIAIGVSMPTVSQWKSGATFPSADKFERLATFLNISVADLVRMASERKPVVAA